MAEEKGYEGKRSEEELISLQEKKELNSKELIEKIEAYFYTDEELVAEFESFVARKANHFVSVADGTLIFRVKLPHSFYLHLCELLNLTLHITYVRDVQVFASSTIFYMCQQYFELLVYITQLLLLVTHKKLMRSGDPHTE